MTENQHNKENDIVEKQLINRGCQLNEPFVPGQKVLACGRCKLHRLIDAYI